MTMAEAATTVQEVKTGKGIGPVTTSIGLAEAAVLVIVWGAEQFGVDIPATVALAFVVLVGVVVGYFTKGRAYVEKTLPPEVPVVSAVPTDVAAAYQPQHAA